MGRDKFIFDPVWLVLWITHLMFVNWKDTFFPVNTVVVNPKDSKIPSSFLLYLSVNYIVYVLNHMFFSFYFILQLALDVVCM